MNIAKGAKKSAKKREGFAKLCVTSARLCETDQYV